MKAALGVLAATADIIDQGAGAETSRKPQETCQQKNTKKDKKARKLGAGEDCKICDTEKKQNPKVCRRAGRKNKTRGTYNLLIYVKRLGKDKKHDKQLFATFDWLKVYGNITVINLDSQEQVTAAPTDSRQ